MGRKHIARVLGVLLALPVCAFALGLGDVRLNSALNAPLDAEIELLNTSPEELGSLKATLASRETFARYGLEWPSFLSTVTLTRARNAAGKDVLRLRSTESITEPFLTLLVDVNWGRGRLVREYTVLLDPPVFAPANGSPAAAETPAVAAASSRSGTVDRPAASSTPAAPGSAGDYRVAPGDTLSGIARRLKGGFSGSTEQLMVGLYRTNPQAFAGNMNELLRGSILRMPDAGSVEATASTAASAAIQRDYSAWRGRAGSGTSGAGRLRLVAPGSNNSDSGTGNGAAADAAALRERVGKLEAELSESKRLLALRDNELADLQKRLASARPGSTPPAAANPPAAAPPAVSPPVASAETPAVTPPSTDSTPAAATPVEPTPAVPARPRRQVATAPAVESPSILDSVIDTLKSFWFVPVGVLALLGGMIGLRRWRESRDQVPFGEIAGSDTDVAPGDALSRPPLAADSVSDTSRLRRPNIGGEPSSGLVVEESGEHPQPDRARSAAPAQQASGLDTLSGETAINLDQSDPMAEADFHMAYGLYDQAADLVKLASSREPERRDLKLKLVEVYFVWGNKDEFLRVARDLHGSNDPALAADWDKIVIMGRQIAPEDSLFSRANSPMSTSPVEVDLDLAGGTARLDFDVLGDSKLSAPGATESVDFDLHPTPADVEPTIEQAVKLTGMALADHASGNTTQQMGPSFAPSSLDADFGADLGEAPTVEQPQLQPSSATVRQKLDAALKHVSDDQTAELALDDLGLDLSGIEGLDTVEVPSSADTPTMVAGLDPASRTMLEEAAFRSEALSADNAATAEMRSIESSRVDLPVLDIEATGTYSNGAATLAATTLSAGETTALLDTQQLRTPHFDLHDHVANTGVHAPADMLAGGDLSLPDLEPVTLSEVGTKLDLARAYMDMGDPDGARSILKEVMHEGSVNQKQEAQRLLESLPG